MTPNEGTTITTPSTSTPATAAAPAPAAASTAAPAATPKAPEPKAASPTVSSLEALRKIADKKTGVTPSPTEDAAEPTAASDAEATPADEGADAPAVDLAAFTPNFKIKVMDKELEIPEEFRGLIKDAESEKKVREIFEKAYGLDFAKPKHQALQTAHQQQRVQLENVSTRMSTWENNAKKLENAAQSNDPVDFEQFLRFWKIPKEKLYAHATYLLQYEEMSPEQRAGHDRAVQDRLQARSATEQLQHVQNSQATRAVEARLGEVDRHITRPDISEAAREFDTRIGRPGAFRELVIERGQLAATRHGKDLSAEDATREAMVMLGYEEVDAAAAAQAAPQGQPAAAAQALPVAPAAPKKLPVLPTVGAGSGSAPVKKIIGSIDELRKRRAEMMAENK